MNVNLIRLGYWGVVSAVYFMQTTAVQGAIQNQTKQQTVITTNTSDSVAQGVTRVTGVELDRADDGLQVILKTVQGKERLVPLILPKGNSLVIDILDATLSFSIRNGVSQTNPSPGIGLVSLDKIDDSRIRLTITGENQTPSVDIVPGRNDLVLNVTPEGAIEQEPDREIEVIVTGEAEDDENKTVLYRLNVAAETSGSFVDFYDRDRYLVNPVLAWNISDKTKLTTEFEYRSTQQLRDSGLPAVGTVLDNPNGNIPLNRYPGDPSIDDRDIDAYRFGYNFEHEFSDNWRIRNAFDTVLSRANSLTISNRSLADDGRTLNRSYFDNGDGFDVNAYTLDTYTVGKFNTGSVKHELVAGIELSRNEVRSNNTFFGSVDPLDLFTPQYRNVTLGEPTFFFDRKRTDDGLGIYLPIRAKKPSNSFVGM